MRTLVEEIRASWERFVDRDNAEYVKGPKLYGEKFWLKMKPIVFFVAPVVLVTELVSVRFHINPIFLIMYSFFVAYSFLRVKK